MGHIDGQLLLRQHKLDSSHPKHLNPSHLIERSEDLLPQMDLLAYYLLKFRKIGPFQQTMHHQFRDPDLKTEKSLPFHDHVPRKLDDYKSLTRTTSSTPQPKSSTPKPQI